MRVLHNADTAGKQSLWAKVSFRLSPPTFDLVLGVFASAAVVMAGEIGGAMEEEAAEYVQGMSKPEPPSSLAASSSSTAAATPPNKLALQQSGAEVFATPQCK